MSGSGLWSSSAMPVARVDIFWAFLLFICFFFFSFFFFKWYLGYCFPLEETLVFEFVLVSLFLAVPFSDSNSDFTISVIFWWLLLFSSGSTDRPALIYSPFAFITVLCSPLRGPGHLFDPFPTLCSYFSVVLVWFGLSLLLGSPLIYHL
jgi:hypothetical protein